MHLKSPVVGIASAPDGKGYWLVARAGGVFPFGSATFYGSLPALNIRWADRADRVYGPHRRNGAGPTGDRGATGPGGGRSWCYRANGAYGADR